VPPELAVGDQVVVRLVANMIVAIERASA
jgi:hypothetical protein